MHESFAAHNAQGPQARPGANPLRGFEQQRNELTDQLTSLTIQRDLLTQQLRNADPAGQQQLQAQIKSVGDRTTQVIKQLAAVDDASSKAWANARPEIVVVPQAQGSGGNAVISVPPPIRGRFDGGTERVAIFGIVFGVLGVTAVLLGAMRFFRRPLSAGASTGLSAADVGRIERLQQAVDVIALEVERISEAQRFMSKVLGDGKALGPGPAEAIRIPAKERAKAP